MTYVKKSTLSAGSGSGDDGHSDSAVPNENQVTNGILKRKKSPDVSEKSCAQEEPAVEQKRVEDEVP